MQNDRFDAIPIPESLGAVVKDGIRAGIRQRKRFHRLQVIRHGAAAAALLIALCTGVICVSNPALAAKLPLVGRIFSLVQEKVSYKGDFSDGAVKYGTGEDPESGQETGADSSGSANAIRSEAQTDTPLVQTSNGLTVTISEANCSAEALYLALCIENEEAFPADFIKTKNMDGYILDYDILSLETNSYYDVPGLTKQERPAGSGYSTPYYIEGAFADDHTFTGIIRVSLEEDLRCSGRAINRATAQTDADLIWEDRVEQLPQQFTYYLEISDIYADLLQYEEEQATDPETGETVTLSVPLEKHYAGTWNFAIPVTMDADGKQVVRVDQTNESGVGIASVEKTDFEIKAELLLPDNEPVYDYVVVICDADGKRLDSQGDNAEVYSTYGRNTDTVYVYVCDYMQYMDELKGSDQKIAKGALFTAKVDF